MALIGAGLLLLLERARTEGLARVWPVVLVVLGMGGMVDDSDDAWYLIGTGFRLLVDMTGAAVVRSAAPLLIIASGLAAFQAATRPMVTSRGRSHAN
jgi:hypothetical protein